MLIPTLKKKLCRDLVIDTDATELGSVAITSFLYPNGDSVNLYFGSMGGDLLAVSDEGATTDFLKTQGIELTPERRSIIKTMCQQNDVEFITPALRRQFEMPNIGNACIELCEAIIAVASIFYQVESPVRSSLPVAIEKILRKRVGPTRGIQRDWVDRRHDPEGSFAVDFRMNGIGDPRNIFPVTSSSKSIMVAATGNFLRSHNIKGKSLAVIDKDAGLGHRDVNRLQLATDEIIVGLAGHESKIVNFALGNAV